MGTGGPLRIGMDARETLRPRPRGIGLYGRNLAERNIPVCRFLKEKFPEWSKDFSDVDHLALAALAKLKDKPEPTEWR